MRVILKKDVQNVGLAGDIVTVKNGYARHYLFPKKQAVIFTEGSAKEAKHRKQWIEAQKKKALELRKTLAEKIQGQKLSFVKSADAKGKLFGSLTSFEISKALNIKGFEIDKRSIKLDHPIKETGEHTVPLAWGTDLKAEISVKITASIDKKLAKADESAETKQEATKTDKSIKTTSAKSAEPTKEVADKSAKTKSD